MFASPSFNIQAEYEKYKNILKNAEQGKVVTRFPPEPSGYLHIGHVKAALLNYHYAKMYGGLMIFRLDDTNPSKEKDEFVDSIKEDLMKLGIKYDKFSHSSDHFEYLLKKAEELIADGLAYCDNTSFEETKVQRLKKQPSKLRDTPIAENLRIFKEMQKAKPQYAAGEVNYSEYCLRAKIQFDSNNGVMRDPVIYRTNFEPHHQTGTKYVVYPTYDFCCPLVDSLEGVTHAMRSNEYADRIELYYWFLEKCKVPHVELWQFSRLNFVNTLMSKRKLQWFVDTGRVEGWHDPRMPTVRGILRRGLRVETLTEFMLGQGPSQSINLMEWDKIWATNKAIIDPIAPRFQSVKTEKVSLLNLTNIPDGLQSKSVDVNPLNKAMGTRPIFYSKSLYIDHDDAVAISGEERITLMGLGIVQIKSKQESADGLITFTGTYLPDDTDFKKTQKITFLCKDSPNVRVNLIELDHLINVKKLEEEDTLEGVINEPSRFETSAWAESAASELKENDVLQFTRRGYFRVDKIREVNGEKVIDCIFTPDGRQKGLTDNIQGKVDQGKLNAGNNANKEDKNDKVQKRQDKKLKDQEKQQAAEQSKQAVSATEALTFPFAVTEESLAKINLVLKKQLFFSGTHFPGESDIKLFQQFKKSKQIPSDKYQSLYAWYGTLNNYNPSYLESLIQ